MGDDGPKVEGQPPPLVAPALQARLHPAPSIGPAVFADPGGVPRALTPVSEGRYHGEQGMYLAASGTLTQFNAILAALLTAALSLKVTLAVKIVVGVALTLHAVAGFLLCWAARPVAKADGTPTLTAETMLARSLQNYRRGWQATMLALAVSALVLASLTWEKLVVPELLPLIR